MTRKEYLQNEVENLVNDKVIPIIKDKFKDDQEIIKQVGLWSFMYSVGRLESFQLIMYLATLLTKEEIYKVFNGKN